MLADLTSHPEAVLIPMAQRDAMKRSIACSPAGLETGGIVIGKLLELEFGVTLIGPPGPRAVHKPDYFLRDLEHARIVAQAGWDADRSEWIGEWHTHPLSGLTPSAADLSTYRRHLNDSELRFDRFLSLVAKMRGDQLLITAWSISLAELQRVRIQIASDRV